MVFVAIGAVLVVAAIVVAALFNRLVALRQRVKNAFAQIDVQLQRRHDLIPNVVEAVRGYAKHERETLEAVTAARGAAEQALRRAAASPADAEALGSLTAAEGRLGACLARVLVLREAYPDLKASTTFGALMEELSTTENRIAFARQAFNDAVMSYNTAREVFPGNVVARRFAFAPAAFFDLEDASVRSTPAVRLA